MRGHSMSKHAEKRGIDAPRRDVFLLDPDDVVFESSKDGALYDERAQAEPDEAMVRNVMALGVLEPVLVRKDGACVVVIAGRRRTLAAREANRRLKAQGAEPLRLPVMVKRGSDGEAALMMVAENEHRADDAPLAKARKAERLARLGRSDDEIACAFGVSVSALKGWQRLLECCDAVQKAVEQGKIAASAAVALSKLPHAEQREKLAELIAAAPATGKRPTARAAREKVNGKAGRPGVRVLRGLLEKYPDSADEERALLAWVLGDTTTEEAGVVLGKGFLDAVGGAA